MNHWSNEGIWECCRQPGGGAFIFLGGLSLYFSSFRNKNSLDRLEGFSFNQKQKPHRDPLGPSFRRIPGSVRSHDLGHTGDVGLHLQLERHRGPVSVFKGRGVLTAEA